MNIIIFLILIILLAISVPVASSMGMASILSTYITEFPMGIAYIVRNMGSALDNYALLAIPLFILSGTIMARGGISERIFNVFIYMLGNKTAGVPIAAIVTCLFYGAISGSSPATVAAVGAMAIPILTKLGYEKGFSTAMVATAGGLGVIMPPSIPFIIYGITANQSIGNLFLAGIIPSIIVAVCLMIYAYYYCKNKGEDREKVMTEYQKRREIGLMRTFKEGFFALLTPVIILGGIYGGLVTPTEAGVISVIYALLLSFFVYKTINIRNFPTILAESIKVTIPATFVFTVAAVFARVMTFMNIPQAVGSFMSSLTSNYVLTILLILLFLLTIGMVMETLASIIIVTPIFLPIAVQVGVDPIMFGVIMIVALALGFVTPPVGMNLYIASSITDVNIMVIARKSVPFIIAFMIALLIISFIPALSLIFI